MAYVEKEYSLPHARACRIVGQSRTNKYYKKVMPEKDSQLKTIISEVIGTTRKGREKVIRAVQKRYPEIGSSKIRRVYEREGFSLHKKLKKRVNNNPANPILIPATANQEWAMDFMSDSLADGRKFRTLNVIDHYNRGCLGIKVNHSLPARLVIAKLEQLIELYGKPGKIRTDNGPEFTSKLFQCWLKKNNIAWSAIQKGKPQQNAIVERFNRTYREDILDAHLFETIAQADTLTQAWIEAYNNERPHQSLGYKTPLEYAA